MNFNRLSKKYDTLMTETVGNFCKSKRITNNKKYCLFYPSFGIDKQDGQIQFIIYGQATNGWIPEFDVNEAVEDILIKDAIKYSNTLNENSKENSPLDWVNINWSKSSKKNHSEVSVIEGYCAYRSFFWNVCNKLISDYYGLGRESPEWCKKMVWSNLMKIAPAEGGNPNKEEWETQLNGCIELFKMELDELQPKYVILLTNWNWAEPFVNKCEVDKISGLPDIIKWVGKYQKTRIIVTKRPPFGNSDIYVKEIIEIIKR